MKTTDSSSSHEEVEEVEEEEKEKGVMINWLQDHVLEEEVEREVERNWVELPPDVMSLIFLKLGHVNILASAQWVCTSWWKLSKQPHLFRSIHVDDVSSLFERLSTVSLYSASKLCEGLAREAIDRSCGQLVEFSVRVIDIDELLHYISQKSASSLRCIRLISCHSVNDYTLIETAEKLPLLEELEIIDRCFFSTDVIESFGRFCPNLKSCRLNYVNYCSNVTMFDVLAVAIVQKMSGLHHLNLIGNNITDVGLEAILDGCQHLKSLDLRECSDLKFAGDLKMRCANIKLRLPNDPIDDFKYELQRIPTPVFSNYYSDFEYD